MYFLFLEILKTDGTSLLILFLVKNFEEKEIEFLKERFCQKLSSNNEAKLFEVIFPKMS